MPVSELRLIKRCAEFLPKTQVEDVPRDARGIYTLLKYRRKLKAYDVVYVGYGRSVDQWWYCSQAEKARDTEAGALDTLFCI